MDRPRYDLRCDGSAENSYEKELHRTALQRRCIEAQSSGTVKKSNDSPRKGGAK